MPQRTRSGIGAFSQGVEHITANGRSEAADIASERAGDQMKGVGVDVIGRGVRSRRQSDVGHCCKRGRDRKILLRDRAGVTQPAEPLIVGQKTQELIGANESRRRAVQRNDYDLRGRVGKCG
jgi:hypothetical protein